MVLTKYNPGFEQLFKDRHDLVWFKTLEQFDELYQYYLSHDSEREKIASNGRHLALKKEFTIEGHVKRIFGG
jgi:spore maturation protein CgeB